MFFLRFPCDVPMFFLCSSYDFPVSFQNHLLRDPRQASTSPSFGIDSGGEADSVGDGLRVGCRGRGHSPRPWTPVSTGSTTLSRLSLPGTPSAGRCGQGSRHQGGARARGHGPVPPVSSDGTSGRHCGHSTSLPGGSARTGRLGAPLSLSPGAGSPAHARGYSCVMAGPGA